MHVRVRQFPDAQHRRAACGLRERAADDARPQARVRRAGLRALDSSIAITGALVQWLRDKIGLVGSAPEIETLAVTVEDNGGCYSVPRSRACLLHAGAATPGGDRRTDGLYQ